MIEGIDVSRWQQTINWHTVKQNKQFAMIKIGGSDVGLYMDGMAVRNVLEARAVGMPIGFYVYLGGTYAPAEEVQHIKNLITNIGGLRPGESIALDWEENHPNEVTYLYQIAKGLIDAGFPPPLIYMNLAYVRRQDWGALVGLNCGLWVAAWGNNDSVADTAPPSDEWRAWAIWQYSSTGKVPGISGNVDLNQFNGSVDDFKKYGSSRTVTMPAPVNIGKAVSNNNTGEYVVKKGDTLTSIAAQFGLKWQDVYHLNRDRISNPNRIFPRQALRVPHRQQDVNPPLPTPTHNSNVRTHTVQPGENLSVIAAKHGLNSWTYLWEANKGIIPDPDFIRPGQVLRIP